MCVVLFGDGIMFDCYTDGSHDTFLPSVLGAGPGPGVADETLTALNDSSSHSSARQRLLPKVTVPRTQDCESLGCWTHFLGVGSTRGAKLPAHSRLTAAFRDGGCAPVSFRAFWSSGHNPSLECSPLCLRRSVANLP